jgi:transposase
MHPVLESEKMGVAKHPSTHEENGMRIKTILNRLQRQPGFVYGRALLSEGGALSLDVEMRPRGNSRPQCSVCGQRCPGYDRLPQRRFEFVPLWGLKVFFLYAPRRVNCPRCGVRVEGLPWASGKQHLTTTFCWFLARWATRLSWSEVAEVFHITWHQVFGAVEMAVEWGREHLDLDGITALGIDEIQWLCGQHYLTLVYQIDAHCKRLLWIGKARTVKTLLRFFRWFGKPRTKALRFLCSDLWRPYLKVVAKKAGHALHVLDRFHIMALLSKAIDQIRAQEARDLKAKGYEPVLTRTRWLLLKRPENLTANEDIKLADLLRYNLRSVRGYLLKEEFQLFWGYVSPAWAGRFLDHWCTKALRSRLQPMMRVARTLRAHRELLLNWFRAKGAISGGIVEGFNNKAKLTTRRAFGFRTYRAVEVALYHTLGGLPEPKFTHRF